jgi:hypothetical protein
MENKYAFVAVGTVSDPYLIMRDTVEEIDEALASLSEDIPFTIYDNYGCLRRSPEDSKCREEWISTEEERLRYHAHLASVLAAGASIQAAIASGTSTEDPFHCHSVFCWFVPNLLARVQ